MIIICSSKVVFQVASKFCDVTGASDTSQSMSTSLLAVPLLTLPNGVENISEELVELVKLDVLLYLLTTELDFVSNLLEFALLVKVPLELSVVALFENSRDDADLLL